MSAKRNNANETNDRKDHFVFITNTNNGNFSRGNSKYFRLWEDLWERELLCFSSLQKVILMQHHSQTSLPLQTYKSYALSMSKTLKRKEVILSQSKLWSANIISQTKLTKILWLWLKHFKCFKSQFITAATHSQHSPHLIRIRAEVV